MPSYSRVFTRPSYLAISVAAALSTWGDYLARVTVAVFVFQETGSPFAAAATFAVSLLPSIFGRSLLAPIADRLPYKYVLIVAHLLRAVLVGGLIIAVSTHDTATSPGTPSTKVLWLLFSLLFLIELVGGPAIASSQILMTDLFSDRRLYARALGLSTLSEQVNQAIGLGLGGLVVAWVGPALGLWSDLATFVLSALVVTLAVRVRAVRGTPSAGVFGFFRDIGHGPRHTRRPPVRVSLLAPSLSPAACACRQRRYAIGWRRSGPPLPVVRSRSCAPRGSVPTSLTASSTRRGSTRRCSPAGCVP